MGETIILLTQSPLPRRGRVGPERWQDWHKGCEKAAALAAERGTEILVASAFETDGISEAEFYQKILEGIGAANVMVVKEGLETIDQLDAAFKAAAGRELIIISSVLHFPRVRWLCRGKEVRHQIIFGIPRPKEAVTSIILSVLFPAIDLLGFRDEFQRRAIQRREKGRI